MEQKCLSRSVGLCDLLGPCLPTYLPILKPVGLQDAEDNGTVVGPQFKGSYQDVSISIPLLNVN